MLINNFKYPIKAISSGTRLCHLLIDLFVIYQMIYCFKLFGLYQLNTLFSILIMPIYYIVFEYVYQVTPGKSFTKTIVINHEGNKPSFWIIVLRTFCRFIPFDAFSYFDNSSYGWHDRWSKTYVVYKEDHSKIKAMLLAEKGLS